MYESLFDDSSLNYNTNEKRLLRDNFINNIYYYFLKGGFYSIIISKIIDVCSMIFLSFFALNVFIFLDWDNIMKCNIDCGDISEYLNLNSVYSPNFFQIMIFIFVSGLLLFSFYKIIKFFSDWRAFYLIDKYYTNTLNIKRKDLHSKTWEDVINAISHTNERIPIDEITSIILKKENYFTALINNDIFKIPERFFTKQMELTLYYGLNPFKFSNKTKYDIKKRLIILGIINLLLSPFILIYIVASFIFYNIDELYLNKKVLGPRRYTEYFKWEIREYNELQHYFENRINFSMKYAIEYTKQFPSRNIEIISKFIGLISGAFIVLFLILSLLDENILLFVKFLDRSLIFYTGIFASISAITRGYIREPENIVYNPNDIMNKVSKYTHYMPKHWNNKCHTFNTRDEFLNKFKYIMLIFLYEIISVVTTPYLLFFVISEESQNIENFLKHNTSYKKSVGYTCRLSDFAYKKETVSKKMEMSIASFSENHPTWSSREF